MRKAAIISACVHVMVIALVYFGVPSLFRPKPVLDVPVAVELVASLDQPPPAAAKPPAPKPAPAPPPKVERPPPPPPSPPVVDVPPPPEVVPLPQEKPKPKPKPVAKPKPPPKPAVKVATVPPAPVPRRKPKPPPDQFQTLLKNLAKEKRTVERSEVKKAEKKKPAEAEPFDAQKLVAALNSPTQRTAIDRRRLGSTLAAMVKQQVTPCWSIPGGAKDVQDMKIAVRIQLNPDGTLRGAPRLEDTRRLQADPFYRAVAESALRALRNPRCTPLKLPLDQYDIWKDITFLFEPGEALGQ